MSGVKNEIQKSMENIRATADMKRNTLFYLEAQRTKKNRSILQHKQNMACLLYTSPSPRDP